MMMLMVKIVAAVRNHTVIASGFVLPTRSAPIKR